ncbi:MAG TPA: DUF4259 domain-containing protein [Blastocatellia bacterium]|nr:DUF4259 domain-containing protein [Blastocatellia bacterium]
MGAWGTGSFDNDTACDWAHDLKETSDLSLIESTLDKVLKVGAEYLDASEAEEALAAAETVARLKGNWGIRDSYTEIMDKWVETTRITPPQALIEKAMKGIERVLSGPSELLELWGEVEGFIAWEESVKDLSRRLKAENALS